MLVCDNCRCAMDKYRRREVKITIPSDNPWQGDSEKVFEICPDCADRLVQMLTLGECTYDNMRKEGYL